MSQNEEVFTAEERRELAVKAVNRLIADAEAKRLPENKELTETIRVCIGEAGEWQLRALKWLLEEQDVERPAAKREKKLRAQRPLGGCALFRLSRKVFTLPGSIWRER
jgi:hypothetical protein